MRPRSLTARFVLTLLLSTALPFLAFGWWASVAVEQKLEQQVVRVLLREEAQHAAERISSRLLGIEQMCALVENAARKVLLEGGDPEEFRATVDFTPGIGRALDLVLLVDHLGKVVGEPNVMPELARSGLGGGDSLLPRSVVGTEWFRRISEDVEGQVWEGRHLSAMRHRTPERRSQDPRDYSMGLAFAVPSADGVPGAIYALIRWATVQDVLDRVAATLKREAGLESVQVFVLDEGGRYLGHTQRQRYEQLAPAEFIAALREAGNGAKVLDSAQPSADSGAETQPMPLRFVDEDGAERLGGHARVGIEPLGWTVGLTARSAELLRPSRDLSAALLLVTAVTALILVAWSMIASRAILRPVRRLVDASVAVADGALGTRVPARGSDELAELGRSFNSMLDQLTVSREQLREAERQAAWAEMARQVAHEIKNPLTPMRMSAQLLLRAKAEGDERANELSDRLARVVIQQTDALARIASDFRQFAGPPERKLEALAADDLVNTCEAVYADSHEARGAVVEFHRGAGDAEVEVDVDEMRRVLVNLIDNGLAAVIGAGHSGVDLPTTGRVSVRTSVEGGSVMYRIEDNGPGIDPEARPRLFEPYFTTKSSGTGLGLAICHRVVQTHGGHVVLESSESGRTVFRVELPRRRD